MEAESIVSPKITEKIKDLKLKQGLVDEAGKVQLSDWDKKMAETAAPYVKKGATPQANLKTLGTAIEENALVVEETLKLNDVIFNQNQLRSKLKSAVSNLVDDLHPEAFEKAKDRIINVLLKQIDKNNLSGLWQARKDFDKIIDNEMKAFSGSPTIKKDLAKQIRNAANEFIIDKSPNGKIYEDSMERMTKLYQASDNIVDKVLPSALNQNKLEQLGKQVSALAHKAGLVGVLAGGVVGYNLPAIISNPAVLASIVAYGSYKIGEKVITSKMLRTELGNFLIKAGKYLNPEDTKNIKAIITTLDSAIKSEEGFAKLPGTKPLAQDISQAKASGQSFDEWVKGQEIVYHGTPNKFDKFDYKFIGTQGSSEGRGFYFTDKKDIAKGYSKKGGQLIEAKIDIKKPISLEKKEITKADLKKFIDEYDKRERALYDGEGSGYLDNVGDINYKGRNKVLDEAVELEYNGSNNDVDIIHSIVNSSGGDNEFAYSVLKDTLGYDGIIAKNPSWGKGQTITVAFSPDQIKTRSQLKAEWDKAK